MLFGRNNRPIEVNSKFVELTPNGKLHAVKFGTSVTLCGRFLEDSDSATRLEYASMPVERVCDKCWEIGQHSSWTCLRNDDGEIVPFPKAKPNILASIHLTLLDDGTYVAYPQWEGEEEKDHCHLMQPKEVVDAVLKGAPVVGVDGAIIQHFA